MFSSRAAGVLLHPTSLPGPRGCGDLGASARAFVDFLGAAGVTLWQLLPLGPVGAGDSPYAGTSVFAGNPLLVSVESLAADGLLPDAPIEELPSERTADFVRAKSVRLALLRRAFEAFRTRGDRAELEAFRAENGHWLEDFAVYAAAKQHFGDAPFYEWPLPLARRDPRELALFRETMGDEIDFQRFVQWRFFRDLAALASYAHARGVRLVGDAPIYVAHDSCDVWAHPELFLLDGRGELASVAGVPPDAFSDEGQRWGNPLYDWDALERTGFGFFLARLALLFRTLDAVRLDHFIGFSRYWAIPSSAPSAKQGTFHDVPGERFFETVKRELGDVPIIAEDLGVLTDRVKRMRDQFGFPGMNILQFSFSPGAGAEESRPHNYRHHSIVYTGTHDNDTSVGFFQGPPDNASHAVQAAYGAERAFALEYLGLPVDTDARTAAAALVRACFASHVRTAIVPMQDLLLLDRSTRMNRPGTTDGNWGYRLLPEELGGELASRTRRMLARYGRV